MRWEIGSLGALVVAPVIALSGLGPTPLPNVPVPTELLAQSLYLRGTKIGSYSDDDQPYVDLANAVLGAVTGTPGDLAADVDQVDYNGGFWPISKGGLADLTYGASVQEGLTNLTQRIGGTDDSVVVVGYSQSAVILAQYKANTTRGDITYVMLSDPARPNGGILSRFRGFTIPVIDIPLSGPAPTTSPDWDGSTITTHDIAQQYDGWADFPMYPLNLLATANAVLGIAYLHGHYEDNVEPQTDLAPGAANTDSRDFGDTRYYTVGTDLLPLLRPLEQIGVPHPLVVALDAPLRVLVEQGYDRTLNPGADESARLVRIANPVTDITNFVKSIPVGIDDGFEAAGYDRPLHTTHPGMYGVGGPTPTPPPETDTPSRTTQVTQKQAVAEAPEQRKVDRPKRPQLRRQLATDRTPAMPRVRQRDRSGPRHLSLAPQRPDHGHGYVGKHRKADHDSSGKKRDRRSHDD